MKQINYSKYADMVSKALTAAGAKLVLSRYDETQDRDVDVAKSYGVVIEKKQETDTTGAASTTKASFQVLVPPSIKTPPVPGDHLTIQSKRWYIEAVKEEKPAGVVLLYTVDVL